MSATDLRATSERVLANYLDRLLADVAPDTAVAGAAGLRGAQGGAGCEPAKTAPERDAGERAADDWRERPFQALVFNVHALSLAAPLARLDGVVPCPAQLTTLPGLRPWELGVVRYRERNVRVVDTARIVLAGRDFDADAVPGHLVIIDGGRGALACHRVMDVVTLQPQAVQWRSAAGRRPWLAGTVRERLCALLDLEAFARLLNSPQGPLA